VVPGSVGEIDAPEAESGLHGIQHIEQPGPLGDEHITLHPCLKSLAHLGI
jgi:hypothetical protein